jgi:hypothetical protein
MNLRPLALCGILLATPGFADDVPKGAVIPRQDTARYPFAFLEGTVTGWRDQGNYRIFVQTSDGLYKVRPVRTTTVDNELEEQSADPAGLQKTIHVGTRIRFPVGYFCFGTRYDAANDNPCEGQTPGSYISQLDDVQNGVKSLWLSPEEIEILK